MKLFIVYRDKSGGVLNSSKNLIQALQKKSINITAINIAENSLTENAKYIFNIILKHKNSKIVLMHFDAMPLGIILNLLKFKNLIYVFHTDLHEYYIRSNPIKRIILKTIILSSINHKKIFVSKESELKSRKHFQLENTHSIYNILSFKKNNHQKKINKTSVNLGIVSRLEKSKNIDFAILLISKLIPSLEIKLFIFGEGKEIKNLKRYILELKVQDNVFLLGHFSDKNEIYKNLDGVISFSEIEGFGITILESLSFNIPVLHTDCSSGPREIIAPESDISKKTNTVYKNNNGFLVKPYNPTTRYKKHLEADDYLYLTYLKDFIIRIKSNDFSISHEFHEFDEEHISNQWIKLIL